MDLGSLGPDGGLPISAYAKLEFEQFSFFIQTLTLLLGRKAKPGDNVDVHLGASKSISRNHAKIHYHFHASAWEIEVLGKNGAFVNERYVGAGETFPLHNEDKLQIAETPFTFLLPEGAAPPVDPSALAQGDFDPLMSMPVETVMPSHTMNMEYMSDMLHPTTPLAPHDLMMGMQMEIPQLDDSLLLPPDQVSLPLPQALPGLTAHQEPERPTPKKKPRKKADKRKDQERQLQYVKPQASEPTLAGLSALLETTNQAQPSAASQAQRNTITDGVAADIRHGNSSLQDVIAPTDGSKPKKPRKKYTRKPKPDLNAQAAMDGSVANQVHVPVPVPVSLPGQHNKYLDDQMAGLQMVPSSTGMDGHSDPHHMVDDSHIDRALLRLVPTHDDDLDGPSQQAIITQNGRTPAEQQAYNDALARQQAIEEEGLILPPEETDPEVIASFQRPTASYATLIYNAITSHFNKKMTLAQIYNWICLHHPYYRYVVNGWQNSIRHNLSLNKAFMKVTRTEDEPGKGAFWAVDPEQESLFENGVYKKRPPKPVMPPLTSRGNPVIMKDGKLALNPNFFVGTIHGKVDEAVKLLQDAIQKQLGENTTPEKATQIAQALALALATQLKQAEPDTARASTSPNAGQTSADAADDKAGSHTNGATDIKRNDKPKPKPSQARPATLATAQRPAPVKHARSIVGQVAMPVSGPSVDERQRQAALHKAAMDKAAAEKAIATSSGATQSNQDSQTTGIQSDGTSSAPPVATRNGAMVARSASPAVVPSEGSVAAPSQLGKSDPISSKPVPGRAPYQALPGRPVQVLPPNGRPAQAPLPVLQGQQVLPGRPVQGPSTMKQQQGSVAKTASRPAADLSTPVIVKTVPVSQAVSAQVSKPGAVVRKESNTEGSVEFASGPTTASRAAKRPAEESPANAAAAKTART